MMRAFLAAIVLSVVLVSCAPRDEEPFDVLIINGQIVDGSGNPWFYGDVGIRGEKIVRIGKLQEIASEHTIDAAGKIIAPGFVDMLGQSSLTLLVDNRAMSKISQGITTEINGEGVSAAPVNERTLAGLESMLSKYALEIDWHDFAGYFKRLETSKIAINVGSLVGATQVRTYAMGSEDRDPTENELSSMKQQVRLAMKQGTLGLSTSLIYAPATFAKTNELIELAKVSSEEGGIYITHLRDEGNRIQEAIHEALDIARGASTPVEIWHLKVAGKPNWGKMASVVGMINEHRAQGIDLTADVYPYAASSTGLSSRIPSWAHDGGSARLVGRLKDMDTRQRIRREMMGAAPGTDNTMASTGPEDILIAGVYNPQLKEYEGKRLSEIARMWGKHPVDMLMDLVVADSARITAVFFSMSEQDVRMAMAQPWASFCTDGGQRAIDGPLSDGKPHPRAYGSFPRILGKYVRDEKLLSMEEAIRKMTSLPANRLGLRQRGLLKEGFFADVVIFDPHTVNDKATFEDPHQYSVGIEVVLVNGKTVWEGGKFTGNLPGKVLRGPGYVN